MVLPVAGETGWAAKLNAHINALPQVGHTHVATTDLTATGTKNATTFLRGDNTWAVPAGGGGIAALGQQFRVGHYYGPWRPVAGLYDTFAPVAGTLYASPFFVGEATPFDQIAITVQTAAAAGSRVRMGVYKSERLVPTTLIVDAGSILTDTTGQKSLSIGPITIQPGLYWLVCVFNGAPQVRAISCGVESMYLRKGQAVGDWHDGNMTDNWRMTGYDPTVALPATASLTGLVDGSGVSRDVVNINIRAA